MRKIKDLVYKNSCYKIVGIAFELFNELGSGHREQYYQNGFKALLRENKIPFSEQSYIPLEIRGKKIGRYYLDFLIDNKIVVELKVGSRFPKKNIEQVYSYLKSNNLKLGIIINFTKNGVEFKRIANIK